MKDLNSLVKSYVHAQKMVGADKIIIPQKGATQEQWNEVFTKLGLPKKEDYKINKVEKSVLGDEFYAKASELGHQLGILPQQMQGFVAKLEEEGAAKAQARQTELTNYMEKAKEDLKKEWGEAFEAKLYNASTVFQKFADDATKQYLRESGLSNDPRIVRLFEKIGSSMKEAKLIEGKDDSGSPQDIQTAINNISGDKNHPYWNKDHIGHAAAVREMERLFSKMY
jgi:hypothetical protein